MKKMVFQMLILLVSFGLVGCGKKAVRSDSEKSMESQKKSDTEMKMVEVIPPSSKLLLDESVIGSPSVEIDLKDGDENKVMVNMEDVFFDYDQSVIGAQAIPLLEKNVLWLLKNKTTKVVIEGSADERGTNEYNLALSERRARAVRDFLMKSGIAEARLSAIGYGEEKPFCEQPVESCYQQNRRAHIVASE